MSAFTAVAYSMYIMHEPFKGLFIRNILHHIKLSTSFIINFILHATDYFLITWLDLMQAFINICMNFCEWRQNMQCWNMINEDEILMDQ